MPVSYLASTTGHKRAGAAERREWLLFAALVGPNLLLFAVFTYWPLLYNAYLSMVSWDMLAPVKTWVGAANYAFLMHSADFRAVLLNTVVFTIASVGLACVEFLTVQGLLLGGERVELAGRSKVKSR